MISQTAYNSILRGETRNLARLPSHTSQASHPFTRSLWQRLLDLLRYANVLEMVPYPLNSKQYKVRRPAGCAKESYESAGAGAQLPACVLEVKSPVLRVYHADARPSDRQRRHTAQGASHQNSPSRLQRVLPIGEG